MLENVLFFYKINVINLLIACETRKNHRFEITTKKFNREFIDWTNELCFWSKISKTQNSKKNYRINSQIFLKLLT